MTYPDGLKVRIVKISQGTITAQGPGELTGRPKTTFTIEMTNGTSKPINLTQVVVSASYGTPPLQAPPVYDSGTTDFATVLAPGKATSTGYTFSIPVDQLGSVTVWVDFDGTHTAAVFAGSVAR